MKLWNRFKTAESSSDLAGLKDALVNERATLDQKLEVLASEKMTVLREKGPDALQIHISSMRTIEDQIETLDVALADIEERLAAAKLREAEAQLEASAKQAAVDMRRSAELRDEFLTLIMRAAAIRDEDAALRSRIQHVAVALRKAGKLEMKPVDPLQAIFQASGVQLMHPITRPDFINPLKETAHFERLRKKLEAKARAA